MKHDIYSSRSECVWTGKEGVNRKREIFFSDTDQMEVGWIQTKKMYAVKF